MGSGKPYSETVWRNFEDKACGLEGGMGLGTREFKAEVFKKFKIG